MNPNCKALTLLFFVTTLTLRAQQLYPTAQSSAAQAIGGASVANARGPIDAMAGNPAELTHGRVVEAGVVSIFGNGKFTNETNTDGRLQPLLGIAPFGAVELPLHRDRVFLGAAVLPDTSLSATWHYFDSPGTGGADYGYQKYRSSMENLRFAGGLGWKVSSHLALGATAGVVYNTNTLKAPYIFQSQPVVAGLKTLLDLHTRGTGWNGTAGIVYAPLPARLHLGAAYKTRTVTHTNGTATGDLSAQLAVLGLTSFDQTYAYKARIDNTLPQVFTAGMSAILGRHVVLSLEGDFVDWAPAFKQLAVHLTDGSNGDLNNLIGSSTLDDMAPLHWKNQKIYRAGVDLPITKSLTLRGGGAFGNDPVPAATLTPVTAAITHNFLTAGVGFLRGPWDTAVAYEAGLPQSSSVLKSSLLAGEYDNSTIHLSEQSVSVTTSYRF